MSDRLSVAARRAATGWGTAPVLALLCTAQFMVVLDTSIVNVALPAIAQDLGIPPAMLSWVVTGYTVALGGLLLLGGRAGDLFGERRMLLGGCVVFAAASLVGGLAVSGWMLIVARMSQGIGAAALTPAVLALITSTFRDEQARNRALGVWGAAAAAAFSAGVLLGGTLTQWLGWRWVLFVNMPIAMACAAGAAVLLPRDPMPSAVRGLDVWGAVSVSSGLALLVLGFSRLADRPMITLGALAVGVALLGIFLAVEARAAQPLVPLDTLRHGRLGVANLVGTSFGICMGGLLFVLTLYMQDVLGYSPVQGGLAFLPHALVVVVASGTVSRLINRAGPEVGVLAGMALMFGGFELIALEITGSNTPFVTVLLPGTVLAGLGVACLLVSASGVVTATAPPGQEGLVSGLFNTAQQVGVSVGLPVLAAVVQAGMPASAAPRSDTAITAFRWALHGGALVAAAGMVLALLLLSRHDASTRRRPTSRAASSETPAT